MCGGVAISAHHTTRLYTKARTLNANFRTFPCSDSSTHAAKLAPRDLYRLAFSGVASTHLELIFGQIDREGREGGQLLNELRPHAVRRAPFDALRGPLEGSRTTAITSSKLTNPSSRVPCERGASPATAKQRLGTTSDKRALVSAGWSPSGTGFPGPATTRFTRSAGDVADRSDAARKTMI
jgi:hypothetical protein